MAYNPIAFCRQRCNAACKCTSTNFEIHGRDRRYQDVGAQTSGSEVIDTCLEEMLKNIQVDARLGLRSYTPCCPLLFIFIALKRKTKPAFWGNFDPRNPASLTHLSFSIIVAQKCRTFLSDASISKRSRSRYHRYPSKAVCHILVAISL
jgi:hypothetical protein